MRCGATKEWPMLPLLGLAGLYCGCGASRPPTLSIFARPGNRVVKLRLPLRARNETA